MDIADMLARVAEDMEPLAGERDMRMETALESVQVGGNRAMLKRAAINLVDNAIRYGREGGLVRIALSREGEEAVICVTDDGEGISPDALEHVFERFWRGDQARSTQGTGIGLAIVRAAALAHGGEAKAESTPGEGSSFYIRLPAE